MSGRRALLVLVVCALALRLWPIDHGMPRGYVPDGHMVRNALGMARDHDPVPPIGKYSTYPYFVPYLLLPIYGVEYAVGRATGEWRGSGEFANRVMDQPGLAQLPARALMALFGALTVWAVFRAARVAGLQNGAWVAAYLSATCLLELQFSTQERPWAAVVFFGALSLWKSIEYGVSSRTRDLVFAGAAAALAFACHQAGLAFLGIPACSWLFARGGWRERIKPGVVCVAVFAVVAVICGHAFYLRYGLTTTEQVIGGARAELSISAQPIAVGFSLASLVHLCSKLFGYDPLLVVFGVAGLGFAWRIRELRGALVLLAIYAAIVLTNPSDHVRYLLPVCLLLALPAGMLVESFAITQGTRCAFAVALALPLVQALRFDVVLRREDTRAIAERYLAGLPNDATIAIDHYGPLPELSQRALARLTEVRAVDGHPGELRTRENHRLEYFKAGLTPPGGAGIDAIGAEELFEVEPLDLSYVVRPSLRRLGPTPRELFAALHVGYLVLAERRPGSEARPLASLVQGLQPLAVIDPSRGAAGCDEAFLPTEMDFPLTALWQVERPGPRLEIHRLAP